MGREDMARQALNVSRMRMLGAQVIGVDSGSRTLKDAINEAMRDWVTNVRSTHYLLGSVLGAHPYPTMVRDFQSVIGREAREQILAAEKRLPTHLFACVGGGSNAIGLFHQFLRDAEVEKIGIEAGGRGGQLGEHAARLAAHQGFAGARPAFSRAPTLTFCRTKMARSPPRIPSPPASTIRHRPRARLAGRPASRRVLRRLRFKPLSMPRVCSHASKASFPRSESAHAIAGLIERIPKMSKDDLVILTFPAAATRTWTLTSACSKL